MTNSRKKIVKNPTENVEILSIGSDNLIKGPITVCENDFEPAKSIMDYLTESQLEFNDKLKSNANKFDKKISNIKTMNVKYWLEGLPEDKKDPKYKDILKKSPKYAHDGDIGMDLVATSMEYDAEHDRYLYHTGFYSESERAGGCLIFPRSSNSKTDGYIPNAPGLVDSFTYRGETIVVYKNRTSAQQKLMELLIVTWLMLPWYKKLFTNFSKWSQKNKEEASKVIVEQMINEAPYKVGEKVAQMVWLKFPEVKMSVVNSRDKFSKTERGEGGFGSTGK